MPPTTAKTPGYDSTIKDLIETNLTMQDKMADLLINVKALTSSVNKLVDLFTDAAEHIKTGKYDDPLIGKLNDLLEQNKNLAKGLTMLEQYIKTKQGATAQFRHPASEF